VSGDEERDDPLESPWVRDGQVPDWRLPLDTSGLDLNWVLEGGQWLTYVVECLAEQRGSSASWTGKSQGGSKARPGRLICPYAEPTCLWVVSPSSTELRAEVWGMGPKELSAASHWAEALRQAHERLRHPKLIQWYATVVNHSDESLGDVHQRLRTDSSISNLRLTRSTVRPEYRLHSRAAEPYLYRDTYPLIVEGSSPGTDDLDIRDHAQSTLHSLCVLLSVVWDSCWVPLDLPSAAGPQEREETAGSGPASIVEVEPWFSTAFEALSMQSSLRNAGQMFYEGLLLSDQHASLAVVCFTSTIEALAEMRQKDPLPHCESCNAIRGSTQRFRETVGLVSDDSDADRIVGAYAKRSRTVHSGHLHGHEIAFNFKTTFHLADNPGEFTFLQMALRRACRRLLLLAMAGDL